MTQFDKESSPLGQDHAHVGRPQNANVAWYAAEDDSLRRAFEAGADVAELAVRHGRSPYAIRRRLVMIGLLTEAQAVLPGVAVDKGGTIPPTVSTQKQARPDSKRKKLGRAAKAAPVADNVLPFVEHADRRLGDRRFKPSRSRRRSETYAKELAERPLETAASEFPRAKRLRPPMVAWRPPAPLPLRLLRILTSAHIQNRPPRQLSRTPRAIFAAPPSDNRRPGWTKLRGWYFWWDGAGWTGDREPSTQRAGWMQDPYGEGLRWWTGRHWTEHSLSMREGWAPVRPGSQRMLLWWDGEKFDEWMRPMPTGTRVRPNNRKAVGRVIGLNMASRDRPALVSFRQRRNNTEVTVAFAFKDLQQLTEGRQRIKTGAHR